MKVLIRSRHVHAGARPREYVLRRLHYSLGRFSRRVDRATVATPGRTWALAPRGTP